MSEDVRDLGGRLCRIAISIAIGVMGALWIAAQLPMSRRINGFNLPTIGAGIVAIAVGTNAVLAVATRVVRAVRLPRATARYVSRG
jgi:hypothetical protein